MAHRLEDSRKKGLSARAYSFLSSIKLAVVVFFLLAAGSILGTVIEQGLSPQEYRFQYGERWAYWIQFLRLNNVYHSWWFTFLLLLLAINLMACLSKRLPYIWRAYSTVDCDFTYHLIENLRNKRIIPYKGDTGEASQKVISLLKKNRYHVWTENQDDGISVFATKGRIGRLGSTISHISIFIILIGAVVSSALGFRTFYPFFEKQPVFIPQGNFYVVLDKFWIDYYSNGSIKDYFSTLSVIDKGKKVLTKTIQVNDPLQYKGVWFYQSSYGRAWDRVDKAFIRIVDKKTGQVVADETLDFRKPKDIKGTDLKLTVLNFVSHFAYDPETKEIYTKSTDHENPAIQLEIREGGKLLARQWIFYKFPNMFPVKGSKYNFILTGYVAPQYSGLQIAKDPGVNLVWIGSILLMLGLFISFFIFHRRLWIKIVPSEKSSIIYMGGLTNKDTHGFEKEIGKIVESIS